MRAGGAFCDARGASMPQRAHAGRACDHIVCCALASLILCITTNAGNPTASSLFSEPKITVVTGRCAAVEFTYGADRKDVEHVVVEAKRPKDEAFIQWGSPWSTRNIGGDPPKYRVLVRDLPPGESFQVRLSTMADIAAGRPASLPSEKKETKPELTMPFSPNALSIHRTDPRKNLQKDDGSVCIDLHWSHPNPKLDGQPDDVYFRLTQQYVGERRHTLCRDKVGSTSRTCGVDIGIGKSHVPSSYYTICGLRPGRRLRFDVEALNCDGRAAARHIEVFSPPSAPNVVTTLVTAPGAQESIAGFNPIAVIDWIPQHDERIVGHAVYQGLVEISAMKLLCYVPSDRSNEYARGHLEVPIVHMNHTYAEDSDLLDDYLSHFEVHQEQEIRVATRTSANLESPAYTFRLGEWLVRDDALKCLTSFNAVHRSYVSRPIVVSWTQMQGMALYD